MKLVTALYRVSGNVVGQELEHYETTQLDVLGLVDTILVAV